MTTISPVTQDTTGTLAPTPDDHRPVAARIAGAPISWGVCEVPGWGYQLEPGTVLEQMRELGLAATEFGPDGFLADDPAAKAEQLGVVRAARGRRLPPGRCCTTPDTTRMPEVDRFIDGCVACGAGVVVLAAYTGVDGYDARPELDDAGWATLLGNLDRIADHARTRGVVAALHPHVGTMVESGEETERVLDRLPRRALRRHRPPRGRRRATRSRSPPPTPSASCTCTSRTSTPRWPPGCTPAT